jgi:AcrR family transcriptional regulator
LDREFHWGIFAPSSSGGGVATSDNDRYHGSMAALHDTSTRDRLLAAAVEVFVDQGYEGARLQDIARTAGLTTGAVYANFRDKGELLFAAIGARAGVEVDALLAEAQSRQPRAFLELLGDQLVRQRQQPPLLIDAIAAARRDGALAAALRDRLDERASVLVDIVERAKADGAIDPALDSEVFARFGLTLAMGALVMRALQMDAPTEGAWHGLISRLLDAVSEEQPK